MKKKLNVFVGVLGLISVFCTIFFLVTFFKYIGKVGEIYVSNKNTYTMYYWADSLSPIVIFSLVFAIIFSFFAIVSVIFIIANNRTAILATVEEVSDYRARKASARSVRKQAKTERTKAKLKKKLEKISDDKQDE